MSQTTRILVGVALITGCLGAGMVAMAQSDSDRLVMSEEAWSKVDAELTRLAGAAQEEERQAPERPAPSSQAAYLLLAGILREVATEIPSPTEAQLRLLKSPRGGSSSPWARIVSSQVSVKSCRTRQVPIRFAT
jgi:hypothetical protein